MRVPLLALLLIAASVLAGCTDKLTPASTGAGGDGGAFSLAPETGGKDTVFKVDAGKLADKAANVTWDWGDGTLTYGRTSQHKYGFTNGVMTITLLVTEESGKQGIALRTVKLGSGENAAPNVTVRAAKTWVEVNKPVNLTATGRDTDRDPLRYLWTYRVLEGGVAGDGHAHAHAGEAQSAATGQEFVIEGNGTRTSAIFEAPGKYVVKVRALDPKGREGVAETTIDVSSRIPPTRYEVAFEGVLGAGTAGAGVSEKLWGLPAGSAPDTNLDAVRHPLDLLYPANVLVVLQWNDTLASQAGMSASDLDLELRNAETGETLFRSETRVQPGVPPAVPPPFEYNITAVPAGAYEIIVRGYVGAQVPYVVNVVAALQLTPELVAAVEGGA